MARKCTVVSLGGESLCTVDVNQFQTVRELKRKIALAIQIPENEQRLIFGSTESCDDVRFGDFPGSGTLQLTLVRRPPEQAAWLERVRRSGAYCLHDAPLEIRADREVILAAGQGSLQHATAELQSDRDFVISVVCRDGWALGHAAAELQGDREVALAALGNTWHALASASVELRREREVVAVALRQDGEALRYASSELRANREVVLVAVQHRGTALQHAAVELQGAPDLVLVATRRDPCALQYATEALQGDREFMLRCIQENWRALQFASVPLRSDRELVLVALNQYGGALEYAAEELRANPSVVSIALQHGLVALEYAAAELMADREFVLSAVCADSGAIEYAVCADSGAIEYAVVQLRREAGFISTIEQQNPGALKYLAIEELASVFSGSCRSSAEDYRVVDSFEDLNLREGLLRGIFAFGFEKPSSIQQHGLMSLIEGRDVISHGSAGTGKSSMFIIGILQRINFDLQACQALVLVLTRELAQSMCQVVRRFGHYTQVKCCACIGGVDIQSLRDGQHIVVGTPGRVDHMISLRHLCIDNLLTLICDEADEMFSRGFKDQIYDICKIIPQKVQLCSFSATMPPEIREMMSKFMHDAIRFSVQKDQDMLTLDGTRQFYVALEREEWKLETLIDLYETLGIINSIIYCNTRRQVNLVADYMLKRNFTISTMHADLDQKERDLVWRNFRADASRICISTDLSECHRLGRQLLFLVINFDLPGNINTYLSRIGRAGCFGRKGVAINFITNTSVWKMRDIERFYNTRIEEMPMDIADLI